jgi:hypothetical protein
MTFACTPYGNMAAQKREMTKVLPKHHQKTKLLTQLIDTHVPWRLAGRAATACCNGVPSQGVSCAIACSHDMRRCMPQHAMACKACNGKPYKSHGIPQHVLCQGMCQDMTWLWPGHAWPCHGTRQSVQWLPFLAWGRHTCAASWVDRI